MYFFTIGCFSPTNLFILQVVRYIFFFFLPLFCALTACSGIKDLKYARKNESLNLSRRGLTEFPEEAFLNPELKVIRLYGNKIDSIPERIRELTQLEKLFIGKNQLTQLPESIGELKNLKVLSVQYNDLQALPNSIGNLIALEQLILNQNDLTSLPTSIGELKNLKELQLNFNSIDTMPPEIGNCSALQHLVLSRNNLRYLPEELGKLTQLCDLDVSYAGPLMQLPESICRLRLLDQLIIDNSIVLPNCLLVLQVNRLTITVR